MFFNLKKFFELNILTVYSLVFFIFIFISNALFVNEEFYISIGLFMFIYYLSILLKKGLNVYLNGQVETEYNEFIILAVKYYDYLYNHLSFFELELFFWLILNNLGNTLYVYKKTRLNVKSHMGFYYSYYFLMFFFLLIKNIISYYYNYLLLNCLQIINDISLYLINFKFILNKTEKSMLKFDGYIDNLFKQSIILKYNKAKTKKINKKK